MDSGTPASMPEVTLASDEPELTAPGESAHSSIARALPERRSLGHYLLLDELGRGGMGVVYAAHDNKLGRKVAIKMLRSESNAQLQRRLIREAQAMAKLAHPNVVSVYEIGEHERAAFIVMEHVEGRTLRQWLAANPRSVTEILAAFLAAGRGLAAIHEAGLIHRDFKPDNVMIRDSGQVLVMDLGIARDGASALTPTPSHDALDVATVDLTRDGTLMGSPAYMAAEQFDGSEVTPKTDQFSFCVSLWEALYGERPFAGTDLATLIDSVTAGRTRAAKRTDVPAALHRVLERGLQPQPHARFESMTTLLAALEHASGSRMRTRKRLAWAAAPVFALASLVVGVSANLDRAPSPTDATTTETSPHEPPSHTSEPPAEPRQITITGTASLPVLSPDGERVVYLDDGQFVHVDLRSGEMTTLAPRVSDVLGSQLSNDGALLFSARLGDESGVYRMPTLDAAPVRVGALQIFCHFPARDLIAGFNVDDKAVKILDASGSLVAERPVEGEYEWLWDIACDARNNRIAVLHLLGGTATLKLLELDGGTDGGPARVLFESAVELTSVHFDQTGDTLYYLATRDGQTNLEATRVAASDDLPITRVVSANLDATALSRADSGRVAHARTRTIHRGIWRLDAADRSLAQAEQIVETDAEKLFFAVSPDETQLAYVESRRNLGRLMIRSLSDGSEHEVTRGDRLGYVAWSPNGQTIAFIAQYRGQPHVWTVPAAGGMPTAFKHALASDDPPLAWAPSDRILYPLPENRNFGVLDPNTNADRPLIADDTVGWPFYPTVSPDGKSVAVLWSREPLGLWAIDIERGTPRLLIEGEYYPLGWPGDGRFIYASVPDNSTVTYYRIPAEPEGEQGRLEAWRTVDFGPRGQSYCQVLSTEVLVCSVFETASDIWISESIE